MRTACYEVRRPRRCGAPRLGLGLGLGMLLLLAAAGAAWAQRQCQDGYKVETGRKDCKAWAREGQCGRNPEFMCSLSGCCKACRQVNNCRGAVSTCPNSCDQIEGQDTNFSPAVTPFRPNRPGRTPGQNNRNPGRNPGRNPSRNQGPAPQVYQPVVDNRLDLGPEPEPLPKRCVDDGAISDCAQRAANGACFSDATFMCQSCCKSCGAVGLCAEFQVEEPSLFPDGYAPKYNASTQAEKNLTAVEMYVEAVLEAAGLEAGELTPPPPPPPPEDPSTPNCVDYQTGCPGWAGLGQCEGNREFMAQNCRATCGFCDGAAGYDRGDQCGAWAGQGLCRDEPDFMCDFCEAACRNTRPCVARRETRAAAEAAGLAVEEAGAEAQPVVPSFFAGLFGGR